MDLLRIICAFQSAKAEMRTVTSIIDMSSKKTAAIAAVELKSIDLLWVFVMRENTDFEIEAEVSVIQLLRFHHQNDFLFANSKVLCNILRCFPRT